MHHLTVLLSNTISNTKLNSNTDLGTYICFMNKNVVLSINIAMLFSI